MRIYTKTGDKGETSLFGGKRVPKNDLRIETYGTVDELNCLLGIIRSMRISKKLDSILRKVQDDLFVLGADLASPEEKDGLVVPRIGDNQIADLEKVIDELEPKLHPLKNFIFPGGTPPAAYLHLARAVCRRAERRAVSLSRAKPIRSNSPRRVACGDLRTISMAIVYLNRLSDLLFILARWANKEAGAEEPTWRQRPVIRRRR